MHCRPPRDINPITYDPAIQTETNDTEGEQEDASRSPNDTVNNNGDISKVKQQPPQSNQDKDAQLSEEKTFNSANDAKVEGNTLFKDGLYVEALNKYELALQMAPHGLSSTEIRSICHANRAACFSKLGKFEEVIKECTKALELNPRYTKVLLRRAEAHEKLEHYEETIADTTKVLELDPSEGQARRAIIRLKPLADEKREKMKDEMIGKLKEMGNSLLGHFGMSVDNFKAVKDPNTGSYSISFQN
ncbi:Tetratricopeptide repeat protein 1 [Sesamum alatum]|uniref:Tetratricopeptide repeat protein 1 n=1 Tax=Sesamum alatum TaxID=300844 RepID=A0AAE1YE37_9LAMI|nr:Tetratricopeptide repeat protein 1 [Sesamum alatum]